MMENTELIKGLRWCADESICCDDFSGEKCPYFDEKKDSCSVDEILHAAADALEAADKRIAELEDELRFQLDTRRKETAEIEQLKAENLKLQKQNRDCGWNCKQCEYVDKDIQAEEAEQRLMELDRRLYERRLMNRRANDVDS